MPKRRAETELRRDDDEKSDAEENFDLHDGTPINNRSFSTPIYRLPKTVEPKPQEAKSPENPWIRVRGLNTCLVKSIQTLLLRDEMADLSQFFEKYVKYWNKIHEAYPNEIASSIEGQRLATNQAKKASVENKNISQVAETPVVKPAEVKPFQFTLPSSTDIKPFDFKTPSSTEVPPKPTFHFSTPLEIKPFNFTPPSKPSESAAPLSFSFGSSNNSQEASAPFGLISPKASQSQEPSKAQAVDQDDEPLEPATVNIIRTGAGEEDEECKAEARVKLFTFVKADGWVDLGVGIFKVNKAKEGVQRPNRILCRGEASGIILLNSAILVDATKVDWEDGKKEVKLTCINQEGVLASYLVRTKEPSQAQLLVNAINELK